MDADTVKARPPTGLAAQPNLLTVSVPKPEDFKSPVETEPKIQLETQEIPTALLSSGEQIEETEAEPAKAADEGDLDGAVKQGPKGRMFALGEDEV